MHASHDTTFAIAIVLFAGSWLGSEPKPDQAPRTPKEKEASCWKDYWEEPRADNPSKKSFRAIERTKVAANALGSTEMLVYG